MVAAGNVRIGISGWKYTPWRETPADFVFAVRQRRQGARAVRCGTPRAAARRADRSGRRR